MIDAQPSLLTQRIESRIYHVPEIKIMIDSDLADLYDVPTKHLNEQVRRNKDRFPSDFMFHLTLEEAENLRSQFATSSSGYGGRRNSPYAFTEHGALMLASVLRSERAIQTSIFVVRAFSRLRHLLASNAEELINRLDPAADDLGCVLPVSRLTPSRSNLDIQAPKQPSVLRYSLPHSLPILISTVVFPGQGSS